MKTFVLVVGAWMGGWAWRKMNPLLRAQGHEVYPVTLTGLGERVHLGTPGTNLSTHIRDVVNVLEFEDLRDVTLVGHSYSGIVVSGAADLVPERVVRVVYLDAAAPKDGQSLFDINPPMYRSFVTEEARQKGDGWKWPMPGFDRLGMYMSSRRPHRRRPGVDDGQRHAAPGRHRWPSRCTSATPRRSDCRAPTSTAGPAGSFTRSTWSASALADGLMSSCRRAAGR